MSFINDKISVYSFYETFKDVDICYNYLLDVIETIFCPKCGFSDYYNTNILFRYKCKSCAANFTIKSISTFKGSNLKLNEIFYLVFQFALNKKNVSSVQTSLNLGYTQKTAWFLMHRIRSAIGNNNIEKLKGEIEIDEVFLSKWKQLYSVSTRKKPILGIVQRKGEARLIPIDNRTKETILNVVLDNIEFGSIIYTDSFPSYNVLNDIFEHYTVNHSQKEFVNGKIYTNTVEGLFSLMKRNIRGAHHGVSDKHIRNYCNEIEFRYNFRNKSIQEKFDFILKRIFTSYNTYNFNN